MNNYQKEQENKNKIKLTEQLQVLPAYCSSFLNSMIDSTSSRTRVAYAYNLKTFFLYLTQSNPELKTISIRNIPFEIIEQLKPSDIEEYLIWLNAYKITNDSGKEITLTNGPAGKARNLSTIKTFYNYLIQHEYINANPTDIIKAPTIKHKNIIRLEPHEMSIFLDAIEKGEFSGGDILDVGTDKEPRLEHTHNGKPLLSAREKKFHNITMLRDLAIATLLLGTGIRVSECAGLNVNSINFDNYCISIVRKGGNEDEVYFGDEVAQALIDYLTDGRQLFLNYDLEDALFLSIRGQRMTTRSIEIMIKKYAERTITAKRITPHKLRSSYGTALYDATGDILLVADVLGHSSIETTKSHYIAKNKEKLRKNANAVKLRSDN